MLDVFQPQQVKRHRATMPTFPGLNLNGSLPPPAFTFGPTAPQYPQPPPIQHFTVPLVASGVSTAQPPLATHSQQQGGSVTLPTYHSRNPGTGIKLNHCYICSSNCIELKDCLLVQRAYRNSRSNSWYLMAVQLVIPR